MQLNITLPTLSEISDKQNYNKIKGYLETLHNQLQYMMVNIEDDNLSDNLSETISTAYQTANLAKETTVLIDDKLSKVSQTADKINWLIQDSNSSTDFSLTSYAASLISETINVTGLVKFSDLEKSGSTTINGSNIISGTITADKLSVNDLSALSVRIGGWYLSPTSISSYMSGMGSIFFNSAESDDNYWIKAYDIFGDISFSISKDGSCFMNGDYIANGTISANKITTDSNRRLDLLNNYIGARIGRELCISSPNVNCRLFINNANILTFDTGVGDHEFSFALNRNGSSYSLSVLNGSGTVVGTINL